jgi:hypothetical protein
MDARLAEQPVLVEDVVGRAHVAGVHRARKYVLKNLMQRSTRRSSRTIEGVRGEGAGLDRHHVAELAVRPPRALW